MECRFPACLNGILVKGIGAVAWCSKQNHTHESCQAVSIGSHYVYTYTRTIVNCTAMHRVFKALPRLVAIDMHTSHESAIPWDSNATLITNAGMLNFTRAHYVYRSSRNAQPCRPARRQRTSTAYLCVPTAALLQPSPRQPLAQPTGRWSPSLRPAPETRRMLC